MSIYNVFSLLGGLAFFLYGMQLLGSSLEHRAGNKLRPILQSLTNSNLKGVLVGAAVTAVIQSSSATTVMLVGFVNSGIMQLHQAISVIFGANIGTTITSWILSLSGIQSDNFWVSLLKPSTFSPILAFVGIIMFFASKRKRDIASILLGFSILMFGMDLMSSSVTGLADVPAFVNLLTLFSNPLFGVLAGTIVTGIIQSSSASVGVLQALANTGAVSYATAFPIIMGQNIGTCVTALISSVGANRNAKRVAIAHLYFNVIGTVFFLILYYIARGFIDPQLMEAPIGALGIAVFHSIFNIACTIVWFPFIGLLEKLAIKSVPDDDTDNDTGFMMDDRLLATPSIAIDLCRKVTCDMAVLTKNALLLALDAIKSYNDKESAKVSDMEEKADTYEDKLGAYLVKVSARSLSEEDSQETAKLLHSIGDFERISDHARSIVECAQEKHDKGLHFSEEARKEIDILSAAVAEIVNKTIDCFVKNDAQLATEVEPLEQVIDTLKLEIKNRHIRRLQNGTCTIELGFILSDLLTNLERVSDHCSNIAFSVIEVANHGELDSHQYLREVKRDQFSGPLSEKYIENLRKFELE